MMKKYILNLSLVALAVFTSFACQAQAQKLSKLQKQKVVTSIGKLMKDYYVFPKVADQMAAYLEKQQKNEAYAKANDPRDFGSLLTRDLLKISKDKHIRVRFNPKRAKQMNSSKGKRKPSPEAIKAAEARNRSQNYGFKKVEILPGNVGYINLTGFFRKDKAEATVASAMGFLANTEGIIIDLRQNGGGSPAMVQLICSYFFGEKPVHLNSLYWRKKNRTQEFWTLKELKGQRMPDKPLYILTSSNTFSAAEEFSYNMQNLQRATIVGETTGGGANPGGGFSVENLFIMFVPTGRAINPITKTNWEGVGVVPHIKTSASQALDKAHLELMKAVKAKNPKATNLDWAIQGLEAKTHPVKLDKATLKAYAGAYTNRRIIFKAGNLYYQRPSISKKMRKLTPLTQTLFAVEGIDYFRIAFKKDAKGNAIAVQGVYEQGNRDLSKKGSIVSK
ncbi:S41 family peptidase [uncultured Microscilla sp.]|uniref:S41 family peptidase n=1 Tax=uncultured Microscilla sp. TaxID=432653 RepID=UPI00261BFF90|nr:S41 family peptidase [uncultured Microscilla sp.]